MANEYPYNAEDYGREHWGEIVAELRETIVSLQKAQRAIAATPEDAMRNRPRYEALGDAIVDVQHAIRNVQFAPPPVV